MALQSASINQNPDNPNQRYLDVQYNYGTPQYNAAGGVGRAQYNLTAEQYGQLANSGLQSNITRDPQNYLKGDYSPGSLGDISGSSYADIFNKANSAPTAYANDLATNSTARQNWLDYAAGGSKNPLTPGGLAAQVQDSATAGNQVDPNVLNAAKTGQLQTVADLNKINTTQPNPVTANATPFTGNDIAKQGLAAAQAAGGQPPQDGGAARGAVQSFTTPATNSAAAQASSAASTQNVNMALANDKGYQQLVADAKKASDVATQGASLLDTYKQLETQAGIPALDTQLLNTQKIINGTEDDIRNEVKAASGFATDSQVLALASARNKTLIQNYNNLLATKTNAEAHINTMIGLATQDRQNAIAAANQQLQIDNQLNDYAQKFQSNAAEGYKNVVSAVGYSGLMNSLLNSDPTGQSLAQTEQILGMQPGTLKNIGTQEANATRLAQIQASGATSPYVVTANGEVWNSQTGYAYTSKQDFLQQTGQTLEQAHISPLGLSLDQQQKIAQTAKAQIDVQYAPALNQANINQSNASAYNSSLNAQKTQSELSYMQANGGKTPAEVQAQQDALDKAQQGIQNDAADLIGKMSAKTNPISWSSAYSQLKTKYFPNDDSQEAANTIDSLLNANNFRR